MIRRSFSMVKSYFSKIRKNELIGFINHVWKRKKAAESDDSTAVESFLYQITLFFKTGWQFGNFEHCAGANNPRILTNHILVKFVNHHPIFSAGMPVVL